jgi:O-antigen ligase
MTSKSLLNKYFYWIFALFIMIPFFRTNLFGVNFPAPYLFFLFFAPYFFIVKSGAHRISRRNSPYVIVLVLLLLFFLLSFFDAGVVNIRNFMEIGFYISFAIFHLLYMEPDLISEYKEKANIYIIACMIFTLVGLYYRLTDFAAMSYFTKIAVEGNDFKDVLASRNVDAYILLFGFAMSLSILIDSKNIKYVVAVVVIFIGITFSLSRGALMGAVLISIYLYLFNRKTNKQRGDFLLIFFSIFIIGLILYIAYILNMENVDYVVDFFINRFEHTSESVRFDLVSEGILLGIDHPINGVGLSNYQYYTTHGGNITNTMTAHNSFVNIFAEIGFFGFLTFCILNFAPLYVLLKAKSKVVSDSAYMSINLLISIQLVLVYIGMFNAFYIDASYLYWLFVTFVILGSVSARDYVSKEKLKHY